VDSDYFIVFIDKTEEMKRKFLHLKKTAFLKQDKQDIFTHMKTLAFPNTVN